MPVLAITPRNGENKSVLKMRDISRATHVLQSCDGVVGEE